MIKWMLLFVPVIAWGQSFAPAPGMPGSTAIFKDSSAITYWATSLTVDRGYLNSADPQLGNASYGSEQDAVGPADGGSVVSLGDGGIGTYSFSVPFSDGPGPDFAIFENGFADDYIELAFVEVSSDGQNYFRFEAQSETPSDVQISNFDFIDCRYIHNLAGKYRATFGTPFDLSELDSIVGLDITAITSVRIVDVVGSIDPNYGTFDSQGRIINDPYPTAFPSGGFDLDGLALLQPYSLGIPNVENTSFCSPNPVTDVLTVRAPNYGGYDLFDISGKHIASGTNETIDFSALPQGAYLLMIQSGSAIFRERILKN